MGENTHRMNTSLPIQATQHYYEGYYSDCVNDFKNDFKNWFKETIIVLPLNQNYTCTATLYINHKK